MIRAFLPDGHYAHIWRNDGTGKTQGLPPLGWQVLSHRARAFHCAGEICLSMTTMARPPFDAGFGVYVHWPFCASKCPYCDFNSHVRAAPVDEESATSKSFAHEVAHRAKLAPEREVSRAFFSAAVHRHS